jgi:hypothetical protein
MRAVQGSLGHFLQFLSNMIEVKTAAWEIPVLAQRAWIEEKWGGNLCLFVLEHDRQDLPPFSQILKYVLRKLRSPAESHRRALQELNENRSIHPAPIGKGFLEII